MVIPAGFEPATPRLGISCSILLSYGTRWLLYSVQTEFRKRFLWYPGKWHYTCNSRPGSAIFNRLPFGTRPSPLSWVHCVTCVSGADKVNTGGVFWTKFKLQPKRHKCRKIYNWRRDRDSNPGNARALNGFRDRPVRPLRHLSACFMPGATMPPITKRAALMAQAKPCRNHWCHKHLTLEAIEQITRLQIGEPVLPVRR